MNKWILAIAAICIFSPNAFAHKLSDSFLIATAQDNHWQIQWDIAVRDLENVLGLDVNQDAQITRQEVEQKSPEITGYAFSRLQLQNEKSPCPFELKELTTTRRDADPYVSLLFDAGCSRSTQTTLSYHLFFDSDPTHTGLVQVLDGERTQTLVLSNDGREIVFSSAESNNIDNFRRFFREGVWHIWIGFDHILFLLTLLLPAVLIQSNRRWKPADSLAPAFIDTVKIVSAFTLAHSVTLVLASLDIVTFPSRIIESLIALSVLVTAINNIWPVLTVSRWQIALSFGLVHGFGFANVLQELPLPSGQLALSLLSFNIGVEAGQLAIVCLFFPLAWLMRHSFFYLRGIVFAGSFSAAAVALFWLSERLFDQSFSEGPIAILTQSPLYSG